MLDVYCVNRITKVTNKNQTIKIIYSYSIGYQIKPKLAAFDKLHKNFKWTRTKSCKPLITYKMGLE